LSHCLFFFSMPKPVCHCLSCFFSILRIVATFYIYFFNSKNCPAFFYDNNWLQLFVPFHTNSKEWLLLFVLFSIPRTVRNCLSVHQSYFVWPTCQFKQRGCKINFLLKGLPHETETK
jgi:hypothetical protein